MIKPIVVDISAVTRDLSDIQKRQIPFAASRAINDIAREVISFERQTMSQVFDRPTPFTLNSMRIEKYANKTSLSAVVGFKDGAAKGTSAGKYLLPEIMGGPRKSKRGERALGYRVHGLGDIYFVPGKHIQLDAYGNIPKGVITKVLSYLQANPDSLSNSNVKKRKYRKFITGGPGYRLFIGKPGGGRLPLGVWAVDKSGKMTMLLQIVHQPQYSKRFPFYETAERTVRERFPRIMDINLKEALRTAR